MMQTKICAGLSPAMINANTAALSVALTVFIMLTVVFGGFFVAVLASKSFREFLTHALDKSEDKNEESAEPASRQPKQAKQQKQKKDEVQNDEQPVREKPAKQPAKGKRSGLAYTDSVPTVPLYSSPVGSDKQDKQDTIMARTNDASLTMSVGGSRSGSRTKTADQYDGVPTVAIPATGEKAGKAYVPNVPKKTAAGSRANEKVAGSAPAKKGKN